MIPKIIHQIWVGPYNMPSREKKLVDRIKNEQTDFEHILWENHNIPELPENLKKIYDFLGSRTDYAFQSDILRIFIINKMGGVYLDVDFELKKGFSSFNLDQYDAFFCTHFGDVETFPNGVFGMSSNHPITGIMLNDMVEKFPQQYWYGPSWIANMIKKYFNVNNIITYDDFVNRYFKPNNIFSINYDEFHNNNYFHHALYAWAPENRKKFEEGTML